MSHRSSRCCRCCGSWSLAHPEVFCLFGIVFNEGWFLFLTSLEIYMAFVSIYKACVSFRVMEDAVINGIFEFKFAIVRRRFAAVSIGANKGWSLLLTSGKGILLVFIGIRFGLQRVNGIFHGSDLLGAFFFGISQGIFGLALLFAKGCLSGWGPDLIVITLIFQASDFRVAPFQVVRQTLHYATVVALQCSNLGFKRKLESLEGWDFTAELFALTRNFCVFLRAAPEFTLQLGLIVFACLKHWHRIIKVFFTCAKFRGKGSDLLIESRSFCVFLLAFSQFL